MSVDVMMTDVETEYDKRFDDVDVESILARVERRPLTFARKKRCLYQGKCILQMYTCISYTMVCPPVREIIHSLKRVDYFPYRRTN